MRKFSILLVASFALIFATILTVPAVEFTGERPGVNSVDQDAVAFRPFRAIGRGLRGLGRGFGRAFGRSGSC